MSFSLWGNIALGRGTRIRCENLGGTRWPSFYQVKSQNHSAPTHIYISSKTLS